MILLIDNYDSFTYNLYQQIAGLGEDVIVKTHDAITIDDIRTMNPDKIIISPGPKRPDNSGVSLDVIRAFYTTIPILGVCLGHQCIGQVFGARVVHAPKVMHGKTSQINHTGRGIFRNVAQGFYAARYHSLVLENCPDDFEVIAWTNESNNRVIMGIAHTVCPVFGVQFHPESFMTEDGEQIIRNFLECR